MKISKNKFGRGIFIALVIGVCLIISVQDVRPEYKKADESELPLSGMKVYKDTDYSFLTSFSFGSTYEGDVNVELETAQQMIDAADVRLKKAELSALPASTK